MTFHKTIFNTNNIFSLSKEHHKMLQLFCKCCQNEFDVVILSGDVKGWNKYLLFVNNLSKMFINHLQQNSKMF